MSALPTVKFNLREEVMKDALQIKNQMGLTWREIALQGLGMAVILPPKIGRPPKPKVREKTEDRQKLEKQIMNIFNKAFCSVAIWRSFLPLVQLSDAGYKFYKFYHSDNTPDFEIADNDEELPIYSCSEIKLPVLSKTFPVYKNGRLNIQGIQECANLIASEEGKLVLTGEHPGWNALGEKGMLTTDGHRIMNSTGSWPDYAVKDLVQVRRDFKTKTPTILIVPSNTFALLNQVMWEDPTHIRPPTTYKNFLLEQGIIEQIYEVDELFTHQGTQDSAIVFTPSKESAWLVQAMKPSPYIWEGKDDELMCTIREVINIAIARPENIIELTNIASNTTSVK